MSSEHFMHQQQADGYKVRSQSIYLCLFEVFRESPVDLRAFSNSNSYLAQTEWVWGAFAHTRTHKHTHTCNPYFNGWIAPIVLATEVITLLLGFCRSSLLATTLKRGYHVPQNGIWVWQEYSHLPEDFFTKVLQPAKATLELEALADCISHYRDPPPPTASVRKWECQTLLWWWWWLWLSTLNFNPQHVGCTVTGRGCMYY